MIRAARAEISAGNDRDWHRLAAGAAPVRKNGEAVMADIELTAFNAVEPADADECFALGMSFSSGAGVAVDLVTAHKWFNIAAARGHGDAARLRREVSEQMSDGEIGTAQRAARDWLKAHPQVREAAPAIRAAA
jgi:TPR repeat protein